MPVTTSSPAPYAPSTAIMEIVNRYRSKGLPTPINAEVLGRAGVSTSLIPRTLQALGILDLIDDAGLPTPILDGLRKAPEADFKARLLEWLNGAYADVLTYVDPATETETGIRDAFRHYNPVGQQSRMVSLFIGLFAAAGVGVEKARSPRTVSSKTRLEKASKPPKPKAETETKIPETPEPKHVDKPSGITNGFIEALVRALPAETDGGKKPDFPTDARAKWLKAAVTVFDLIYEGGGGDIEVTIKGR